ncbi:MAG: hypothetical protein ACRDE8_09325, partial [Ginsengibacter sp.]
DYHSRFFDDKKNTDKVTLKKIPCDKVQTISIHIEGSTGSVNQFMKVFDTQKINSLIVND